MLKIFSLLKYENTCGWHFYGTMEHDQNDDSNPTWHIRRLHVGPESRGSYLESTSRWGPTGFIFRKGGFQRPKAALIVVETKKEKLATAKFLFYFQFLVGPWVRFMIILMVWVPRFGTALDPTHLGFCLLSVLQMLQTLNIVFYNYTLDTTFLNIQYNH